MPHYNLSGLSADSFEQLIQALSLKIVGPGGVIFGNGRQRARWRPVSPTLLFG